MTPTVRTTMSRSSPGGDVRYAGVRNPDAISPSPRKSNARLSPPRSGSSRSDASRRPTTKSSTSLEEGPRRRHHGHLYRRFGPIRSLKQKSGIAYGYQLEPVPDVDLDLFFGTRHEDLAVSVPKTPHGTSPAVESRDPTPASVQCGILVGAHEGLTLRRRTVQKEPAR